MTFIPDAEDLGDGVELPSVEEIDAALSEVPEELIWDWVSRRLIPLFERGYGEGVDGDQMVNSVSHLRVGIGYGIDFGPIFGRVTQSMARRWEASVEQIDRAAFAHLAEVVAGVGRTDLQPIVHRGHFFRVLGKPAGWPSSVILAGEAELIRIFGTRDAIFTLPARNSLLAFGPGTPSRAVEEVTWELSRSTLTRFGWTRSEWWMASWAGRGSRTRRPTAPCDRGARSSGRPVRSQRRHARMASA